MAEALSLPGGWIVTGERLNGRKVKRHYLVAVESADEALQATQKYLGEGFLIEIGGRADEVHFKRRQMKPGEVFELGGR